MNTDPIVDEVRAAREKLFSTFDHDLDKFLAWIKECEAKEPRPVLKAPLAHLPRRKKVQEDVPPAVPDFREVPGS